MRLLKRNSMEYKMCIFIPCLGSQNTCADIPVYGLGLFYRSLMNGNESNLQQAETILLSTVCSMSKTCQRPRSEARQNRRGIFRRAEHFQVWC